MSNKLEFKSVHKSIKSLNNVELPDFVVLTGRNGSGKTHLLDALKEGHVTSSLVTDRTTEVILYDWNSIIPKDTGVYQNYHYINQKSNWFSHIKNRQEAIFPSLQQKLMDAGVSYENCSSLSKIMAISRQNNLEGFSDKQNASEIYDPEVYKAIQLEIKNFGNQVYNSSHGAIGDNNFKTIASAVVRESPELFLEPSESKFFDEKRFLWGDVDLFQQAFGKLFSTYRDLIHQNDRLQKYQPKDDSLKYLPESDFVLKYGIAPWLFVNKILETCNLDFRANEPPMHEIVQFEPKLTKLSTGIEMRFNDLSSGEKVLMSFALCLYNIGDKRPLKRFPKLLLLDEVDAPLHPSMVVSLLDTIQNVLVKDQGISVILTTHSPSTVALAPEDSLYEMNPLNPSVDKCSKGRALSILTTGVPTLSVAFDGRRQIFVESRTDASIYDALYQRYKRHLNSERSLVFVEVGKHDDAGSCRNGGCDQVIRIVKDLTDGGNQSILGLVDWDGEREPKNRIHVLSPKIRDGLESLLFDPVLLIATVSRENTPIALNRGIFAPGDTYTSMSSWDESRWQNAVEVIQNIILGNLPSPKEVIPVDYVNNMNLQVAKDYLHLDDHELESKIMNSFPFLRPKNNHRGGLMKHVADTILSENPGLLPRDLLLTFERLLAEDFSS